MIQQMALRLNIGQATNKELSSYYSETTNYESGLYVKFYCIYLWTIWSELRVHVSKFPVETFDGKIIIEMAKAELLLKKFIENYEAMRINWNPKVMEQNR